MSTKNSLRIDVLEDRWLGKSITCSALACFAELLDFVKDSPSLKGNVRKGVFEDIKKALFQYDPSRKEYPSEKDIIKEFRQNLAEADPEELRIFEVFRFLAHGCRDALETNFSQEDDEKIKKLLDILDKKSFCNVPRDSA